MSKPKGRGAAWTDERGTSEEGRRGVKGDGEVGGAPEASGRQSTSEEGRRGVKGDGDGAGGVEAGGGGPEDGGRGSGAGGGAPGDASASWRATGCGFRAATRHSTR